MFGQRLASTMKGTASTRGYPMELFHVDVAMNLNQRTFRTSFVSLAIAAAILLFSSNSTPLFAQLLDIPPPLVPWKEWSRWDDNQESAPSLFNDPRNTTNAWSSALHLETRTDGGLWHLDVQVYLDSWVYLPGDSQHWPQAVFANDKPIAVLLRENHPAIWLKPGAYRLQGEFRWSAIPQKISLPTSIGIVSLVRDGTPIPIPTWDASGTLWLNRQTSEEAEQNRLTANVYRLIEDGIPVWLRTQIDLSVSGKSREEELGCVLPDGWILSSMESKLPVAIDEAGNMKIQVRQGNWSIHVAAYRRNEAGEIRYLEGNSPIATNEFVGFRPNPKFRVAEIEGLQAIDVQKTTFPDPWRAWQVYQWDTSKPFQIVEKMRGMGTSKPKGLDIVRRFWLDDNGSGITFQDLLQGAMQQTSRLDVTEEHQLGMVRLHGERQLITKNPITGSTGIEIRSRYPQIEALGRIDRSTFISASGWMTDVNSLQLTLSLPPGWRMFAVFGADIVDGDWLTAWSLLDLFLVLVFALGVYRLFGIPAGLLALLAFGLAYHEPGSPRWTWLFLLLPVALLRVVREGKGKRWLEAWRYLALGLILLNLVPFLSREIQLVLYPQLDSVGTPYSQRTMIPFILSGYQQTANVAEGMREDSTAVLDFPASNNIPSEASVKMAGKAQATNLAFDPSSRMQTGPARPEWTNNTIYCRWDGPVTSEQRITPIYISRTTHRLLSVVRCLLLLLLAALFFRNSTRVPWRFPASPIKQAITSVIAIVCVLHTRDCSAQFPDQNMLEQLRKRSYLSATEFANTATISQLDLQVEPSRIQMSLEIHTANQVAIPIPGKLTVWSPRSVRIIEAARVGLDVTSDAEKRTPEVENQVPAMGRREDGHLWVVVPPGVHRIQIDGFLAAANDWELDFVLPPKRMTVVAPQWQVVGLGANQVPESQLFFTRLEKSEAEEAKYDQRVYRPIVMVERRLELGLVWKVQNKVTRLSSLGKAVALKIPLLNGERIVSSIADAEAKTINVNLAADQMDFSWESELEVTNRMEIQASDTAIQTNLTASSTGDFVERWVLVSSPIWHVVPTALAPIYEEGEKDLMPTWQVWPGEKIVLDISRPQAVDGESVTIARVGQTVSLGARQSTTDLSIDIVSSLGGDFALRVDPEVEISSISINKQNQPIRRNDEQLLLTLQPGEQRVHIEWSENRPLQPKTVIPSVHLPVASANITTFVTVPSNRWILWTDGPMRGPAVRMWVYLITSLIFALILGGIPHSPLTRVEWILLALGLTQLHAIAGLIVVGWLLLLSWRGGITPPQLGLTLFRIIQVFLVLLTVIALSVLLVVVAKGLLGSPEMFIVGNGSYGNQLNWFEPKVTNELPRPMIISISIWFYRLSMLLWALWLASALIRWLQSGWQSFGNGGRWLTK